MCDTFAVLKDVYSYQPELASKIITAAQTSARAETASSGASASSDESADPDTNEVNDLAAAKNADRFWSFWSSGREAVVAELAAAEQAIRTKYETLRAEKAALFIDFEEFATNKGTGAYVSETEEYNGHLVTWNYTYKRGDTTHDKGYVRIDNYKGAMRFVPQDGGPMFQVLAETEQHWRGQWHKEMELCDWTFEELVYKEDPNRPLTQEQREWIECFEDFSAFVREQCSDGHSN